MGNSAPAHDDWNDSPALTSQHVFEPEEIAPPISGQRAYPANDDQQSIGQILRALQNRPPRTSYFVAAIFSGAWIVGCLALSWAYLGDVSAALGPNHSPMALMIGLGTAALLPIIFFFGVAHMAWRSQELRLIAQSMAQVAMRLAEPESVARESIVTVGQAIRREVAAMGDGVERALARASELEAMVRNEVAALERTYSDNEVRIRGLLQDLANQRDTLVGQAEQVRSAINNVHIDLTQDLSTISDLVGQQVNEAAERITHSLAEKGEHITVALGQIGDNMIQQLSVRGEDLIVRLEGASEETARALATASEQLTTSLNFKTDHISEEFSEIARGLEDMMSARLDSVTDNFSEKSLSVVDMMVGRSQELTELDRQHLEPACRNLRGARRGGKLDAQGVGRIDRSRPQSARRRRRQEARSGRRACRRVPDRAHRQDDRHGARDRRTGSGDARRPNRRSDQHAQGQRRSGCRRRVRPWRRGPATSGRRGLPPSSRCSANQAPSSARRSPAKPRRSAR